MRTFVTLMPETQNVSLTKDVGMIPFILYKYYGFHSSIVTYDNDNYEYLNSAVKGLNIIFLDKVFNSPMLDGVLYLMNQAKKIDILQLYHITSARNYLWILCYKMLNRKGKVYLKLDANDTIFDFELSKLWIRRKIRHKILRMCELITVESIHIAEFVHEKWKLDVVYLPNGFYDYETKTNLSNIEKEKIILTVGRLGTYEKANEMLVQACIENDIFSKGWKLLLVGSMEKDFEDYVEGLRRKNQQFHDGIVCLGEIRNRERLNEIYAKAAIFCLTSRYEGFPLTVTEAMSNGCYQILSSFGRAREIVTDESLGKVFEIGSMVELKDCICDAMEKFITNKIDKERIQEEAYERFNWITLSKNIVNSL